MNDWTECSNEAVYTKALACAKGSYQRAIIEGRHNLSGSTLRGKAKSYGHHYAQSRAHLLTRLTAAGIRVSEKRGSHNRRILVLA